jgi:putative nucleotidyltransferase with HDIG domain
LRAEEEDPYFAQPVADQRHGYRAALMAGVGSDRRQVIRAALLHDIGKRHSQLAVLGRSIVTGLAKLGVRPFPRGSRADLYLRHGEIAADELLSLGAEPLVVEFARWHHQSRPGSIDAETWNSLVSADH